MEPQTMTHTAGDAVLPHTGSRTPTRSIEDLPGPPRLPLLGNLHQMMRPARAWQVHLTAERWSERYGPIFRFDVGPRRMVTITDADAINTILRDRPDGFRRWAEQRTIFEESVARDCLRPRARNGVASGRWSSGR